MDRQHVLHVFKPCALPVVTEFYQLDFWYRAWEAKLYMLSTIRSINVTVYVDYSAGFYRYLYYSPVQEVEEPGQLVRYQPIWQVHWLHVKWDFCSGSWNHLIHDGQLWELFCFSSSSSNALKNVWLKMPVLGKQVSKGLIKGYNSTCLKSGSFDFFFLPWIYD